MLLNGYLNARIEMNRNARGTAFTQQSLTLKIPLSLAQNDDFSSEKPGF